MSNSFRLRKRLIINTLLVLVILALSSGNALAASYRCKTKVRARHWQHARQNVQQREWRKNVSVSTVPRPKPIVSVPTAPKAKPIAVVPIQQGMSVESMVSSINAARRANGLSEVRVNSQLNQAALAKSQHMMQNNYFAHTAPDGTTDWSFVQRAGYRYSAAGVNLAKGNFGSAQGLVDAWMNSAGHRANILADFGQEIGIGAAGEYYAMFITKPL